MLVNGTQVDGLPKKVRVNVRDKVVELTCCHIGAEEVAELEFKWNDAPAGFEIHSKKIGNRIANTLKKGKTVVFDSLSTQAMYTVLEQLGWDRNKSNRVFTKSNTMRKESQTARKGTVDVEVKAGAGI